MIGAGGIGLKHLEALSRLEAVRISAVVDADSAKAEAAAGMYGGLVCKEWEEALEISDAVWICTPPSSHRRYALEAVAAGKPVMCEKPLASTIADAQAVVEAAAAAGIPVAVGFNMRFRPGFNRLKTLIEGGGLGRILSYWCLRIGNIHSPSYNWRTDPREACGMSVESLSHDIDLVRWMLGEVIEVRALVRESRPELPGFDDNACVLLTLENGCMADIHASWSSRIGLSSRGAVGTDGAVAVEGPGVWDVASVRWRSAGMEHDAVEYLSDTLDIGSYRAEADAFLTALTEGKKPASDAGDGLAVLRVSHAILESSRSGEPVRIRR